MPADSKQANIPYLVTRGGLLEAITTAEDLTTGAPLVITGGASDNTTEILPSRRGKRNIVACSIQNTGETDVYIVYNATPATAENHHIRLAPYQQLDLSKMRDRVVAGGTTGNWRLAVSTSLRASITNNT